MGEDRGPAALLPAPLARALGFALLALLGAAEWRRMIGSGGALGALAWVAAAVLSGELAGAAGTLPARRRVPAAVLALGLGLLLAALVAGLDPALLVPAHWPALVDGVGRGLETLSGVTLPYQGTDPWPVLTLRLGGALLLVIAAALASWPRRAGRGYPFLALAVLLALVVTPIAALGSSRSLVLGAALAVLTVCFLWLERLPLRPGLGAVALCGLALAGALPLSAAADREGPWFDYRAFTEGLATPASVRFDWDHSYGPLSWNREGRELLRIKTSEPHYWKVENLEDFDGRRWATRGVPAAAGPEPEADLDPGWHSRPGWIGQARITVRGLRSSDFVGAGTTLAVKAGGLHAFSGFSPGTWQAERELHAGDSYDIRFYTPKPIASQVGSATSGANGEQAGERELTLPLTTPLPPLGDSNRARPVVSAQLEMRPFDQRRPPVAHYERRGTSGSGVAALRNSPYWRTWRLAQRLKLGAPTSYAFARRVDAYLHRGFRYDESPAPPRAGQMPLDAFLFDAKAGYCQHYSGAMALLLRMGGVPARVATGFSPGGYRRSQGEWIVRDRDAHSWVEAWFDGIGWVTLDPTPTATPARSLIAAFARSAQNGSRPSGARDTGARGGFSGRRPAGSRRELDPAAPAATPGARGASGGSPWLLPAALAAVVLGLLAGALARRRRLRALGPLSPAERAVADLVRALERAGRPIGPGITLAQLERRLGSARGGGYLAAVRDARYGPSSPPPPPELRRAFRRELAAGLGWRGRVRAWWALPPRLGRHRDDSVERTVRYAR